MEKSQAVKRRRELEYEYEMPEAQYNAAKDKENADKLEARPTRRPRERAHPTTVSSLHHHIFW